MGYERTELVEAAGQFAVRGGIIDIYSPTAEQTFRIELWDNEIDSIRLVNTNTQRSTEKDTQYFYFSYERTSIQQ